MADPFLDTNDLVGFANTVQQSNPWGIAGRGLGQAQFDMSTWSPATQGITSFGKAFLSGLMQNYAARDAASQLQSVVGTLPQLRSDPINVAVPEGVDSSAFNLLKGSAVLKNAQLKNEERTLTSKLLEGVLGNAVTNRQIDVKDAVRVLSSENPLAEFENIKPISRETSPDIGMVDSPLATGATSTFKKYQQYYNQLVNAGQPPVQAATAARAQIEGELKANNKSFDEAKAARDNGQKLLALANTAEAGMAQAGQTGSSLASGYEKLVSALSPILPGSQEEAIKQSAGDTLISSIAPDLLVAARPPGVGAMSDPEMRVYLGTGPSADKTPQENAVLVNRMKKVGQLNMDYADFLEAYKEANAGSTSGAGKLWGQYVKEFPIFKNGEIDETRPSWNEFFTARSSGQELPKTVETQTYSVSQLRSAGYTDSDISALRAQGKVK